MKMVLIKHKSLAQPIGVFVTLSDIQDGALCETNSLKLLTIITKRSILDVWRFLNTPLQSFSSRNHKWKENISWNITMKIRSSFYFIEKLGKIFLCYIG